MDNDCGGAVGSGMASRRRAAALLAPLALCAGLLVAGPAEAAPVEHGSAKANCQRTLASYPILRPGDRKAAVRTLQCSLNDVGVGPVVVDGFYGPQTKAAVKEITDGFEGPGLPHPYRINNGFWVLLFGRQLPDSNLAIGAHGPTVKVLQRALRAAGGDLVVDGNFGAQTEKVVKAYQNEHHVRPANGVVNENTRFFLGMGGVFGDLN
jgi:peptidoglycan hydrolase-like protein with peptidoglycan-binding domain